MKTFSVSTDKLPARRITLLDADFDDGYDGFGYAAGLYVTELVEDGVIAGESEVSYQVVASVTREGVTKKIAIQYGITVDIFGVAEIASNQGDH